MEKYKTELKHRMTVAIVVLVCAVGIFTAGVTGLFDKIKPEEEHFASYLSGFQTGLFSVLVVFSVIHIFTVCRALRNEDRLKAMHIKEYDERTAAIRDKAGYNLFVSIGYVILLATIVSGYFSVVVFFTLLSTLFVIEVIYNVLMFHYKKIL